MNITLPKFSVLTSRTDCENIIEHSSPNGLHLFLAIPHLPKDVHDFFGVGGTRIIYVPRAELRALQNLNFAFLESIRLGKIMENKVRALSPPAHICGGKMTVLAPDNQTHMEKALMLEGIANFLNELGGKFQTGIDSGLTYDDIRLLARLTKFVQDVDPSPATAKGIYNCISDFISRRSQTEKVNIAVKGAGNVGFELIKLLIDEKSTHRDSYIGKIWVSDICWDNIERAYHYAIQKNIAVLRDSPDRIHTRGHIFCPCAMGGSVTMDVAVELVHYGAIAVAGSENGPYGSDVEKYLTERDVFCYPDYVLNAGGLIAILSKMGVMNLHDELQKIVDRMAPLYALHKSGGETPTEHFVKSM